MKNVFIPFVSVGQAGDALMMWGIILAHLGPLSTKWPSFKCDSLPTHHYWPSPSLYDCLLSTHLLMAASTTSVLNMSHLYSNVLHSHILSQSESTFGLWWNLRITSCRPISLMLSLQYGLKSLRNVSGTFMNRWHKRESIPELARCTQSNLTGTFL